MACTELRDHELKVHKPQVHLDVDKYFFQSELSMYGTVYQLHYYVATMSIPLKGNLTVTLKIGDTNKLLAYFPLQATDVGGWFVELIGFKHANNN